MKSNDVDEEREWFERWFERWFDSFRPSANLHQTSVIV